MTFADTVDVHFHHLVLQEILGELGAPFAQKLIKFVVEVADIVDLIRQMTEFCQIRLAVFFQCFDGLLE